MMTERTHAQMLFTGTVRKPAAILVLLFLFIAAMLAGSPALGAQDQSEVDATEEPLPVTMGDDSEEVNGSPAKEPPEETFWERMDRYHDETNAFARNRVEGMNRWFVSRDTEPRDVPSPRLRMSLLGEVSLDPDDSVTGKVPLEVDAEISLPDAERFKLFITTSDPNELAGTPPQERDTAFRIGVVRDWLQYARASLGVRIHVPPVLFAGLGMGTVWEAGTWRLYPHQKFYWESADGEGEITSFIADRWRKPWDVRFTSSLKWSRDKMDSDEKAKNGERGWRWDCGFILGYAQELLQEPDIVRFMGGRDLARGVAIRLGVSGGPWTRDVFSVMLLHKGQIRARWLYYYVAPEVDWAREDDWVRTVTLTCGIEAIFWGGEDR